MKPRAHDFAASLEKGSRAVLAVALAWGVLAGVLAGAIAAGTLRGDTRPSEAAPALTPPLASLAGPRVLEARGRVLVRAAEGGRYRGRASPGLALAAGDAVVTGPEARVELGFAGEGRWRVGQQAVWRCGGAAGDASLQAGSALVAVPRGRTVRVEGADAAIRLGEGVWLLTAVANDGFKIVALDRGVVGLDSPALASGASAEAGPVPDPVPVADQESKLRAGEVVFVLPGGRGFGPIVTVFLDELLATSRLVGGFAAELPQAERLRQQGAAQREALRHVSNAFVGGARDAASFQLVVPKAAEPAPPGSAGK